MKAAFLLNFVKFVEWPDPANGVEPGEFAICILGDDPFGLTLDELVAGERVRGRPVVVRRIRRLVNGCQTLFVSSSERDVFRTLRRTGPGVLTVGDEAGFLSDGGMINFVPDGRRLRFDVNPAAAQASGLKISSRLLAVARTVLP